MTSLMRYGNIVAVALCAVVAVAIVMATCLFVYSVWLHPASSASDTPTAGFFALMFVFYAVTIGTFLVVAVGAPLYLLLDRLSVANWPLVLLVGIAPGIALLALAKDLGIWSIVSGAAVAALTHFYLVRAMRTRLA